MTLNRHFCVKFCFMPVCLELWSLAFKAWLLISSGIGGMAWMWSRSYLSDCFHYVRVRTGISPIILMRYGVPRDQSLARSCVFYTPQISPSYLSPMVSTYIYMLITHKDMASVRRRQLSSCRCYVGPYWRRIQLDVVKSTSAERQQDWDDVVYVIPATESVT